MFEWNHANRNHLASHGVTASEAEEVIRNNPVDIELQLRNWRSEDTASRGETAACSLS